MNKHRLYSPSKSKRWMNCDAATQLSSRVPAPPTSKYAAEGTAAHKVADVCVDLNEYADHYEGETVEGVLVDEEMVEGVNFYLDILDQDLKKYGGKLYSESQVGAPGIHPEIGGTVDATLYPKYRHQPLRIYDFKYGRGVTVRAEHNTQGLNYGLCICYEENWIYDTIEIIIVQPRARSEEDRVTRWTVTRKELKTFRKEVLSAIKRSKSKDPKATAGDWCKFCPAAGICPELHNQSLIAAQADFDIIPTEKITLMDPEDLTEKQLTLVLENRDMIRNWLKSVDIFALGVAMRGGHVYDHKIVESRSNRRWEGSEQKTMEGLFDLGFRKSECYKRSLLSPAQIEKLLKKDISRHRKYKDSEEAQEFNELWEKPPGNPALVLSSDKRKEMSIATLTEDDFIAYDD